jgi:hypothetical protein
MPVLVVLVLAAAMALATSLFGWWGVPLTAALTAGVPAPRGRPGVAVTPARAALAGALAWGGFLAAAAAGGRLAAVVALVGRVVGQPGALVLALTLALPAVLAWAAAALVAGVAARRRPRAGDPITLSALGPPSRPGGTASDAAPGSPAAATP